MPPAIICRRHCAIAFSRSNILLLPKTTQNRRDRGPLLAFFFQDFMPILPDGIVLALPASLTFAPARLDPTPGLHSMEHRIKHSVSPFDFVFGKFFDFLNQGVAVALAIGEEGKDERFSRCRDEFFF